MWDSYSPCAQGSFQTPVPIPTSAPGDEPLVCLAVNATWLQYVLGSLKQLMLPGTWGDAADPLVQAAQQAANDLIALFAEATECGAVDVAGAYAGNCLTADVVFAANTLTDVVDLAVEPGDYELVVQAGVYGPDGAAHIELTLWDGETLLSAGQATPNPGTFWGAISLSAHVMPEVSTTYTLKAETANTHGAVLANTYYAGAGENVTTCLRAYPLGKGGTRGADGPPGPGTQIRFTAGCGLEYSTDSGVTWLAVPGWLDNAPTCFPGFNGAGIPASSIDPGAPPARSGSTVASRACNIASYLANVVLQGALNKAQADATLTKDALEFAAGLAGLVVGFGIGDFGFVAAAGILYDLVDGGNVADFTSAASDPTLWGDVTCAIYGAIRGDGEVNAGNFAAVGAALNAITYIHGEVPTALALFWGGLGVAAVRTAQMAGALNLADCSACGLDGAWGTQWQTGAGVDLCNGDWRPVEGGAGGNTSPCAGGVFPAVLSTDSASYHVAIRVELSGLRTIRAVRIDMDAFGHDDVVDITFRGIDEAVIFTASGLRNWNWSLSHGEALAVKSIEIHVGMGGPTFFNLTNIDVGGPEGGTPFAVSNVAQPF